VNNSDNTRLIDYGRLMKLYTAWYCPFAQRAWMTLVHKNINFDYIEVDPYDKTESWLAISRGAAMVPVVIQTNEDGTETTIVESNRVVEYLEDLQPQPPVFSSQPNQKAEQKYWMDHIGNKIVPYFYQFLKAVDADQKQAQSRDNMLEGIATITEAMDHKGPFFNGTELSAVDIAFFPFAFRIETLLGEYRSFHLPTEGSSWQRYHQWYNAVLSHPSFKTTGTDNEDYVNRLIEHYLPYSLSDGQKDVTAD
jgi:glutathione S-transferase